MTHTCIKCQNQYEDEELDNYYCPPCFEQKKVIAAQVDLKVGSTVGQVPGGDLKVYDEALKVSGGRFPTAKSLGL